MRFDEESKTPSSSSIEDVGGKIATFATPRKDRGPPAEARVSCTKLSVSYVKEEKDIKLGT